MDAAQQDLYNQISKDLQVSRSYKSTLESIETTKSVIKAMGEQKSDLVAARKELLKNYTDKMIGISHGETSIIHYSADKKSVRNFLTDKELKTFAQKRKMMIYGALGILFVVTVLMAKVGNLFAGLTESSNPGATPIISEQVFMTVNTLPFIWGLWNWFNLKDKPKKFKLKSNRYLNPVAGLLKEYRQMLAVFTALSFFFIPITGNIGLVQTIFTWGGFVIVRSGYQKIVALQNAKAQQKFDGMDQQAQNEFEVKQAKYDRRYSDEIDKLKANITKLKDDNIQKTDAAVLNVEQQMAELENNALPALNKRKEELEGQFNPDNEIPVKHHDHPSYYEFMLEALEGGTEPNFGDLNAIAGNRYDHKYYAEENKDLFEDLNRNLEKHFEETNQHITDEAKRLANQLRGVSEQVGTGFAGLSSQITQSAKQSMAAMDDLQHTAESIDDRVNGR